MISMCFADNSSWSLRDAGNIHPGSPQTVRESCFDRIDRACEDDRYGRRLRAHDLRMTFPSNQHVGLERDELVYERGHLLELGISARTSRGPDCRSCRSALRRRAATRRR